MKHASRPAARLLLAGRFLVPRAALLALPDGPVSGIDLSTGALVGLSFVPGACEADELGSRIARWNCLGLAGCPVIRDLHWHLGRPLVVFEPAVHVDPCGGGRAEVVARCEQLGDELAAAGLGLEAGPADVALGPEGPYLRRPAIGAADPECRLATILAAHALGLIERAPAAEPAREPPRPRRLPTGAARVVPGSRRTRVALLVSCGLLSGFVASSVRGTAHGDGVAAAAGPPALAAPAALAPPKPVAAPAHVHLRVDTPPPTSRGGAARVLLAVEPHPPRRSAGAPPPAARVVVRHPEPGWVASLFVGS